MDRISITTLSVNITTNGEQVSAPIMIYGWYTKEESEVIKSLNMCTFHLT